MRGPAEHHVEAPLPFHCECSDASCVEKVSATPAEYERVVNEPFHFIVLPGHENDAVERVVAEHAEYLVVEKRARRANRSNAITRNSVTRAQQRIETVGTGNPDS